MKLFKATPSDDVDSAQAKLAAARAALAAARAELVRLDEQRVGADDYEAAQGHERKAERQRWDIDRLSKTIPGLAAELAAAQAVRRQNLLKQHLASIASIYPRLKAAIEAAAMVQTEAMKAREAAIADLGERLVGTHIPSVAYAGFLLPDLIQIWSAENDRVFDPEAFARATKEAKAAVARSNSPRRPAQPDLGSAMTPRAVSLYEQPGRPPERPRNLDDTAPLEAGEVRVRVLRPGYTPADNASQCDGGQVIRLRRLAAERASAAGAVEIIEESAAA